MGGGGGGRGEGVGGGGGGRWVRVDLEYDPGFKSGRKVSICSLSSSFHYDRHHHHHDHSETPGE